MNILIAEDEPGARLELQRTLAQCGYKAIVTKDGLEAWDTLQAMSSPLLVITDLWMPGMAGDELCSRIRASPTLRSCYIIMTTAKQLTLTERVHGRYAGMDAYLIKPYEKLDLHACIQTAARVLGTQAEMLDRLASQELELNKWQRLLSLAICYRCKKVSSFENEWQGLDNFLQENTGINFKITVCPHCKS